MFEQILSHNGALFAIKDGQLFEYVAVMENLVEAEDGVIQRELASSLTEKQKQSSEWSFDRFVWVPVTEEVYDENAPGESEFNVVSPGLRREIPNLR